MHSLANSINYSLGYSGATSVPSCKQVHAFSVILSVVSSANAVEGSRIASRQEAGAGFWVRAALRPLIKLFVEWDATLASLPSQKFMIAAWLYPTTRFEVCFCHSRASVLSGARRNPASAEAKARDPSPQPREGDRQSMHSAQSFVRRTCNSAHVSCH
jgi:hypothetical protein